MTMATSSVERQQAIQRLYDETNKGNYDFLDELSPRTSRATAERASRPPWSGRVQG